MSLSHTIANAVLSVQALFVCLREVIAHVRQTTEALSISWLFLPDGHRLVP